MSDRMKKAQDGDQHAYRELLFETRSLLVAYSQRILKKMGLEDPAIAEDLSQEILLAVHQKRATFDPSQLYTPWLYAIARYKIIDYGRKKKRDFKLMTEDETLVFEGVVDPSHETAGNTADLKELLGRLPNKQREMVEMVKIQGVSIAEVSTHFGMSESAVKVAVHRALEALKDQVSAQPEKKFRGGPQ